MAANSAVRAHSSPVHPGILTGTDRASTASRHNYCVDVPAAPSTLAVRHVPFEDLGILAPLLASRGHRVDYLDAGIDPIDAQRFLAPDLLVVLGGPIGVGDAADYPFLADEIDALTCRLERRLPTLGICLGAQLMAAALGAEVAPTGRVEIGYAPITLTEAGAARPLAGIGDTPVLHWHGDAFRIPEGAERLAETPGFPNQAFSLGPQILGLQFHLEADHTALERWLIGHSHELSAHGVAPASLRTDAAQWGSDLAVRARQVFGAWLDAASPTL